MKRDLRDTATRFAAGRFHGKNRKKHLHRYAAGSGNCTTVFLSFETAWFALRYNRRDEALLLVLNRSSNTLQFKFNTVMKTIDGLETIGSVIVDSGAVEYCIVPDDSVLLTSVMEVKP